MTLILSIDDELVERAREVAATTGKSVDELVREYLEAITSQASADADVSEFRRLSQQSKGRSRGWRFDRNEIHARS